MLRISLINAAHQVAPSRGTLQQKCHRLYFTLPQFRQSKYVRKQVLGRYVKKENNRAALAIFNSSSPRVSYNGVSSTNAGAISADTIRGETFVKSLGWHPSQLVAEEGTNRFKFVPAALANHICLGGIFAWSVFNKPLTSLYGVVAPASSDWMLAEVTPVFSLVMGGFVWGAVFGKYLDAWGPRTSCLIGAAGLGGGYCIVAAGAAMHSIPIIYLGGLTWGLCNGWAYTPPVATLLKWFPDRKGMASGMCIAGYGGGGTLAAWAGSELQKYFRVAPEYLGSADSVQYENIGGQLFVKHGDEMREIVIATAADVSTWADKGLVEGVYAVGTGSTGLIETFACMGAVYAPVMVMASFIYKLPREDYVPASKNASVDTDDKSDKDAVKMTVHNVDAEVATRTPQFWLLYLGFGCVATGAYGFIGAGKTLIYDGFASNLPEIVTPAFGGAAAGRPALIGDLYGLKNVGNLAARQLSVVMPAAFLGPYIVASMRESASADAIRDLTAKIDDQTFANAFASGKDQLDMLIDQKTVTISRLMELAPPGTVDPTPFLYDNSLILLAGIQTTALLTNWALKPVDPKLHEK
eukprot:g9898.t1